MLVYASANDFNWRQWRGMSLAVGVRVTGIVGDVLDEQLRSAGVNCVVQLPLPSDSQQQQATKSLNGVARGDNSEQVALVPGAVVDGQVASVGSSYVGVALGGKRRGRIHLTQASDQVSLVNPLSRFSVGEQLRVKVLDTASAGSSIVPLSARQSELARPGVRDAHTASSVARQGGVMSGWVVRVDEQRAAVVIALDRELTGILYAINTTRDKNDLKTPLSERLLNRRRKKIRKQKVFKITIIFYFLYVCRISYW